VLPRGTFKRLPGAISGQSVSKGGVHAACKGCTENQPSKVALYTYEPFFEGCTEGCTEPYFDCSHHLACTQRATTLIPNKCVDAMQVLSAAKRPPPRPKPRPSPAPKRSPPRPKPRPPPAPSKPSVLAIVADRNDLNMLEGFIWVCQQCGTGFGGQQHLCSTRAARRAGARPVHHLP
jgi:hypothetical protein